MDYTLLTHEGFAIDIQGGPTKESFCAQINDRSLFTLPFGNMVIAKNMFKLILPSGELTGEYELHTSDGSIYLTDIVDYDEKKLSDKFNDPKYDFVLVGEIIIQRHNLKMIKPRELTA